MTLTPGTRLGVYEVTAAIGEGGMGQVYRATDTRLKRQVAIKVLPPSVAADADRLARFQREAEVLASLNHPHIAAIYGLEESGGMTALVMELVEGEDLSQRIARGPIPLDEALLIAKQMVEALEAAHEQGIIHRDLKPANIKVRPDGTVKVLDFGLAKAMDPAVALHGSTGQGLSMSPTITSPAMMTGIGVILGTAAYMSPEQAKGRIVDRRADVWAFGAVLYEMLTAERAFGGEDVSDTLANVLKTEPAWERLPPEVPARVRQVLRACLQKSAKQRIGDMQDVRLALNGAFETAVPQATASSAATPAARVWLAWAIAGTLGIALAAALVAWASWDPAPVPPETRTEIVTPASADPVSFALSPDGRQVVFAASGGGPSRLWLRSLSTTTAQLLVGTEGAVYPFWSPDGRSIGYFAEGQLKRLDIGGGGPTMLATAAPRGGSWNASGVVLFSPNTSSALFRVPASGGQAVAVTKLDRQLSHRFPFFLPDGRQFLFYAQGTAQTSGIYLGSLDSSESRRLAPSDTAGVYLPSGWLLWVRAARLVAQRLDLERQALTGEPVAVADLVAADTNSAVSAVSVSASGLVAYRTGGATRRQLAWFDRSGKPIGTIGEADEGGLSSPRVSPDGRRVAVFRGVQGNTDIWILDGARTSRFTFDTALDRYPIWSADGSWIAFDSNRNGHRDIYLKSSSGGGAEERLVESSEDKTQTAWSGDGRFLLYQSIGPQTGRDLWVLPMVGDRKPWVFLKTGFEERLPDFSPDGRWVAYESDESGRQEIYIRPFTAPTASGSAADASGQWQVSTAGGLHPRWGADGKELFFVGPAGEMMATPITTTGSTLQPGAPVALFPTRIMGGGVENAQGRQYDVTRDGRFLINTVLDDASAPITLLQNWNPEAK